MEEQDAPDFLDRRPPAWSFIHHVAPRGRLALSAA